MIRRHCLAYRGAMATHRYTARVSWSGHTRGYDAYDRNHRVEVGAHEWDLSADPAFRGDRALLNPEDLLLVSAASCQLLSFLAVAARARIDVADYRDSPEAVMPEDQTPLRITLITLRPVVTVRGGGADRVPHLLQVAHRECFIANSLTAQIEIEPQVQTVGDD